MTPSKEPLNQSPDKRRGGPKPGPKGHHSKMLENARDHLTEVQGGRCAICDYAPGASERALALDHCHYEGRIRGLLCVRCNLGIGYFQDDPRILREAALYVERNQF